jgi:hypothetical protein
VRLPTTTTTTTTMNQALDFTVFMMEGSAAAASSDRVSAAIGSQAKGFASMTEDALRRSNSMRTFCLKIG